MPIKTRALCQLLIQRSHHLISDQLWQIVYKMESHYEARMSTAGAKSIQDIATTAKAETGSCESVERIATLYCIVSWTILFTPMAGQ